MLGIGVLGIIYAIVTNMVLSGSQPLAGILLIAFMVFAALSLGYVFWREALNEKKERVAAAPALQIKNDQPAEKSLRESIFEPVPSVTEDTTALLGVKRSTKKLD